MLNYTSLANYNYSLTGGTEKINVAVVIKDVCDQIDHKITVCLFLILTFYVMSKLILPYSKEYFKSSTYGILFLPIVDQFESMSETFALMSISLVIVFKFVQGVSTGFIVWGAILLFFAVSVKVVEFVDKKKK